MCGIFGMLITEEYEVDFELTQSITQLLFKLSESRGKEASGLAALTSTGIRTFKEPISATSVFNSKNYRNFWGSVKSDFADKEKANAPFALIGHSRLVTNGMQSLDDNNQPVIKNGLVGIHNGIIVNDESLWHAHPDLKREYEVDTEALFAVLSKHIRQSASIEEAVTQTYNEIEGAASIAVLFEFSNQIILSTNTGSLFYLKDTVQKGIFVFASEKFILNKLLEDSRVNNLFASPTIKQVRPNSGIIFDLDATAETAFTFNGMTEKASEICTTYSFPLLNQNKHEKRRQNMQRCTKCVLPETFPGISFDQDGVCSVCNSYQPIAYKGEEALQALADKHRKNNGEPDCIVSFSGGRDSSYMLHYVKNVLNLNPVAYTYDWGMVTDLARRNQARLTGKLGIEHILISADIKQKRKNVQKNVKAWLKQPHLGMIPLFMAGDKQYFYYALKLREQIGTNLVFFGGNPLEKTGFKTGFTGISEESGRAYDISLLKKLRLGLFYGQQFLMNPSYINSSLTDTIHAYYSSYFTSHDFALMYHYIPWEEEKIDRILRESYNWEEATDTKSTWRIGDGTAAFYNYIYHTVAGFTENDTLRSNQIREGQMGRATALELVERDNQPRFDSMQNYANQIGFDLNEALHAIHIMPKLY